jgi:pilus assembly protein Flp/PilA
MLSRINEARASLTSRTAREDGQALAEYGLLVALIAIVCVLAVTALGLAISGILGGIVGAF